MVSLKAGLKGTSCYLPGTTSDEATIVIPIVYFADDLQSGSADRELEVFWPRVFSRDISNTEKGSRQDVGIGKQANYFTVKVDDDILPGWVILGIEIHL